MFSFLFLVREESFQYIAGPLNLQQGVIKSHTGLLLQIQWGRIDFYQNRTRFLALCGSIVESF